MKRKLYIVSPREPSGATWLINCFLELGIKTYRVQETQMWERNENSYILTERENILKKWLPILSKRDKFSFLDDIEVEWTHEWPSEKFENEQVIYFVRDPRDSLLSRYKREAPDCSYDEFLEFLDPYSLLTKIDNWYLFNTLWLQHSNLKIFKFEDYKKSPNALLVDILEWVNLKFTDQAINEAIEFSTAEKASKAESDYIENAKTKEEVVNQGGIVGRWEKAESEIIKASMDIERTCAFILEKLGYSDISDHVESDFLNKIGLLTNNMPFFEYYNNLLPIHTGKKNNFEYSNVLYKTLFGLSDDKIRKMKMRDYEAEQLVMNLNMIFMVIENDVDKHLNMFELNQNDIRLLFKKTKRFKYLCMFSLKSIIKLIVMRG